MRKPALTKTERAIWTAVWLAWQGLRGAAWLLRAVLVPAVAVMVVITGLDRWLLRRLAATAPTVAEVMAAPAELQAADYAQASPDDRCRNHRRSGNVSLDQERTGTTGSRVT